MRVLFLTSWYPSPDTPLSGIFVREHAMAVKAFDEIRIVHLAGFGSGINFYKVSSSDEEFPLWRVKYGKIGPIRSFLIETLVALKVSYDVVKAGFMPDIIHAHVFPAGLPAVLLGRKLGVPVVISEHSSAFPLRRMKKKKLAMARYSFARADVVLPVSKALRRAIEDYGIKANFEVVPNTFNPDIFFPNPGRTTEGKKLLFVGRMHDIKNVPCLLAAFRRVKDIESGVSLHLVGDGHKKEEYEDLSRKLDISSSVTFYGLRSKEEIAELMRDSDFLVLPSLYETQSCVVIEALASGLPVIASDVGGIPEILEDPNLGILIPPDSPERLADAMLKALETDWDRDYIASTAFLNYSYKAVGKKMHNIYLRETLKAR